MVLLADTQVATWIGLGDVAPSRTRRFGNVLLALVLEASCLVVIRHIGIRYALGILIPYGYSAASWPTRFWERVNPAPNRPGDNYDYGDDYGAYEYA